VYIEPDISRFCIYIDIFFTPQVQKKRGRPGSEAKSASSRGKKSGATNDDDDICVVEEKLTPMARMKAKVK
jgi:hypothetical protein